MAAIGADPATRGLADSVRGTYRGSVTPMFPLGSVLMPSMPLPLRLFEPRYLAMLDVVEERENRDFGVVLIERGHEVGGGDARFDVGTMAYVEQVQRSDGLAGVLARGGERFVVEQWLADDPYPQARLRFLEPLDWSDAEHVLLEATERIVRRCLARSSEFIDSPWSADIELSPEPLARCWQLAGIAPIGTLDHVTLLKSTSVEQLLTELSVAANAVTQTLSMRIGDD